MLFLRNQRNFVTYRLKLIFISPLPPLSKMRRCDILTACNSFRVYTVLAFQKGGAEIRYRKHGGTQVKYQSLSREKFYGWSSACKRSRLNTITG